MFKWVVSLAMAFTSLWSPANAFALIIGGEGNDPIADPGWPKGSSVVFNNPSRVAWWEGGALSTQTWHAEGRGDTATIALILADFSKIDAPRKQIVIHDGVGTSGWLGAVQQQAQNMDTRIDWSFRVSKTDTERIQDEFSYPAFFWGHQTVLPPRIDLYSAKIDWDMVLLPEGIEVIDRRLSVHGFTDADGNVMEGLVTDLSTGQPMSAIVNVLEDEQSQRIPRLPRIIASTTSGPDGKWVLKNVPNARVKVVVEAEGYAPRIAGDDILDHRKHWKDYSIVLLKSSPLSAIVTDQRGTPLKGITVQLSTVGLESGERYLSPFQTQYKTDRDGRFEATEIPAAALVLSLSGHDLATTRMTIAADAPRQNLTIAMSPPATLTVQVDFGNHPRPEIYYVTLKSDVRSPEKIRITGQLDCEGRFMFNILPPGNYTIEGVAAGRGHRRPTEVTTIRIDEGENRELTLTTQE